MSSLKAPQRLSVSEGGERWGSSCGSGRDELSLATVRGVKAIAESCVAEAGISRVAVSSRGEGSLLSPSETRKDRIAEQEGGGVEPQQ